MVRVSTVFWTFRMFKASFYWVVTIDQFSNFHSVHGKTWQPKASGWRVVYPPFHPSSKPLPCRPPMWHETLTNSKHRHIGATGAISGLQNMPKCVCGWGSHWGCSQRMPRPPIRLGRGHLFPYPIHSILPPSVLATPRLRCLHFFGGGGGGNAPKYFSRTAPDYRIRWFIRLKELFTIGNSHSYKASSD